MTQQEETGLYLALLRQLHARYVLDSGTPEQYIEILPLGAAPQPQAEIYNTRIALPASAAPHCRLEINGRCLIAMESPLYPDDAVKPQASGEITLSYSISKLPHDRAMGSAK